MSFGRRSAKTSADARGGIACAVRPFAQLEVDGDAWRATGNDPQFLLTLPVAQPAGIYRFSALMQGEAIEAPCLYLDHGTGFCEDSRHLLEPDADGLRWTLLAELAGFAAHVRFDPGERAGGFQLRGVTLERLGESEAILVLLARHAARDPDGLAAQVGEVFRTAAGEGFAAAARLLSARGADAGDVRSYADWVNTHDRFAPEQSLAIAAAIDALPARPLLSLVLPVGRADLGALDAWVDAIEAQVYPDWELLLVADGDLEADGLVALDAVAARSSRVTVVMPAVGRIDLPGALARVAGRFTMMLATGCLLAGHALLAFADAALREPEAKVFYADSDRVDSTGLRLDPDFKPDWNPVLLESQDYLAPVAMFDTARVRLTGALAGDRLDGARHDLALRCTEGLDAAHIVHLPLLLAQETGPGEAAASGTAGGVGALDAHFARLGVDAVAEPRADGYRIRHALPVPPPKVALVIPTRDRLDLLRQCVESILARSTYPAYEIVVVDNQSAEPETLAWFEAVSADPRVRILTYDAPFNYAAINNTAVATTDAPIVGLVNNDIEVISPDWIETLVGHALDPAVGAIGAMLYYPDDTIQHAGVVVGLGGVAGHVHSLRPRGFAGTRGRARLAQDQSAVTGACLFVRRDAWDAVGGLDERLRIAFNDIDFCLRLREAGYRNVWTPFAELYHHESASRGTEDTPEKKARFLSEVEHMNTRWGSAMSRDPAYNPNLSLSHADAHGLAWPPRRGLTDWVAMLQPRPSTSRIDLS